MVHKTHYGDGIYEDTKKRKYNITSGLIGLVHESMIDDLSIAKKNGVIFYFVDAVHFIYNGGLFTIKSGTLFGTITLGIAIFFVVSYCLKIHIILLKKHDQNI